ncbi:MULTISPECIES: GntR family transcriptional regulator [Sphingobium]|uniref:GntR family transcriptional regulator n=1 Tax=Sphingobium sp. MI1205 TaxID=407020 RepID=UPI0007706384|nr:GntR family transcriptional regulator [Sphingobium sp. MI1205]AMK19882.1 GntR family transcriptional regulator [Sphingobium sp. MI1205]
MSSALLWRILEKPMVVEVAEETTESRRGAGNKIGSSALVVQAIQHIDGLIGRGLLRPGDAISEPEVGAALSIGRVPVREAIRILAGEGILELVPNRSARVRLIEPEEILERFELLTWMSACAMERLVVDGGHGALADELIRIARRIEERGKGLDGAATLREINRFHSLIIRSCGNRYLADMAGRTRMNHYTRSIATILGHRAINACAPKYPQIAQALKAGDEGKAIKILMKQTRKVLNDYRADRGFVEHKKDGGPRAIGHPQSI